MSGTLKQDFVKIYMPLSKILAVTPIKISSVFYQPYVRPEYNLPWGYGIHSLNYIWHSEEPEGSNGLCGCKRFSFYSRLVLRQTASKIWSISKLRVFGNPLETWRGACCCWAAWTCINGPGCWKHTSYVRLGKKDIFFFFLMKTAHLLVLTLH